MSLVEKEITQANIERARNNPEFEKFNETEHKLTPTNPDLLKELFQAEAVPVEQIYLSTPWDEFSQRVRCVYEPTGPEYTAAQKSRGEINGNALKRQEIPTEISEEAFTFYQGLDLPRVRKLRTKVMPGVTVDFYDDPTEPVIVEVESEDTTQRAQLLSYMQELTGNTLVDRSDDPSLTNEAIAMRLSGKEYPKKPESLDSFTHRVLGEILAQYAVGKNQIVTGLTGMSGSGKSTVAQALSDQIVELLGEEFKPIVISTDDYHFGKKHLEEKHGTPYTTWDAARTYNLAKLARHIKKLAEGKLVKQRAFNFEKEEVILGELFQPSPFIIIEGVHASSAALDEVRDLHFELPTSPSDSMGRDNRRLIIDNRANHAFPTAPDRYRYQIEHAYPAYLNLRTEFPERKSFSACARPLASRAFALAAYSQL